MTGDSTINEVIQFLHQLGISGGGDGRAILTITTTTGLDTFDMFVSLPSGRSAAVALGSFAEAIAETQKIMAFGGS